jgi:cobalt-zinc-cadmium efflux system outer membrane protein
MMKSPLTLLALVPACCLAQEAIPPRAMTLQTFVENVLRSNQDALAQRFNVTSAQAQISINRLMPDPELTTGISSKELYGPNKAASPTQYTLGLSWTLETGGKRAARVAVAQQGVGKAQADLETFLGDLRLTAENAFVDALRARLALERKRRTLEGFREVVRLNEIRFKAGDIGGVEFTQARVEAQRFEGEVFSAQADLTSAQAVLAQLLGDGKALAPAGNLNRRPVSISVETVLAQALLNRVDLVAARKGVLLAEGQQRLAKANRWVDLGVSVGVNHTPAVYATGLDAQGSPFPAPANMSNALSATLTIPLPFSRSQRGELVQADAARAQARLELQSMEQKTRADAASAVARYEAAAAQLATFHNGILKDSDKVVEGIQFSYRRGNASLLEFIEAQHTNNEVYLEYYDALAAHAKALAALDRLSGTTRGYQGEETSQ